MAANAINLGQSTQNFLTFPKYIYILGIYHFFGYNICGGGPGVTPKNVHLMKLSHILKLFQTFDDIFGDIECF